MNVLVLVVDSLRRDYIQSETTDTPTFDRLADEGMDFEEMISAAPWTLPSVSSLVTGQYPHTLGRFSWEEPFEEGQDTVFTILKKNGYEPASFVFDEKYLFSDYDPANVIGDTLDEGRPVEWLQTNASDASPFCLYLHYWWTHMPYEPKDSAEAWRAGNREIREKVTTQPGRKEVKATYRRSIERMDDWLSDVMAALETGGILDETVLVVLGDHGESWCERTDPEDPPEYNFALHGRDLYDEVLRVPALIWSATMDATTVTTQVQNVDLLPTTLELLERESDFEFDTQVPDGQSVLESADPEPAFSFTNRPQSGEIAKISVRTPPWKLIWNREADDYELYHLEDDPGETTDRSETAPEVANQLSAKIESKLEEYQVSTDEEKIDESVYDHLEDLGYM